MRTDQKLFYLKCFLIVFTILLWLIGAVIFGVLLWLRLDFWSNEYVEVNVELQRYLILLYIGIVTGGLIVGFGILGIVAAVRAIKWALVCFILALVLALLITAGGIGYGFYYREELEETMKRGTEMRNFIQQRYLGTNFDRPTYVIDLMQSELKCCGGESRMDYLGSAWRKAKESEQDLRKDMAPASCCSDYERHQNSKFEMCPFYDTSSSQEKERNPKINLKGCGRALTEFFSQYIMVVAGIAIALFVMGLINVILASVLLHILRNLYVPQPEEIVYDMAHNQEKSPYPSRGDYRDYYR